MAWARRRYRGHKAWILVDERGEPVCDDRGLAQLRYRPDDERMYTVQPQEIHLLEDPAPTGETAADAIHVWIRVARGNRVGLGVVLSWRDHRREIERTLRPAETEQGTTEGIRAALAAIRRPELPVRVHLPGAAAWERARHEEGAVPDGGDPGWRAELPRFPDLRFVEAPTEPAAPHAAVADRLARRAADLPPPR